jgi:hypothetical protein
VHPIVVDHLCSGQLPVLCKEEHKLQVLSVAVGALDEAVVLIHV